MENVQNKLQEMDTLFHSERAIIFYKDRNNRYLRVNDAFASLIGIPLNYIEGKSANEIIPHFADIYLFHDKDVIDHDYEKRNILEPILTTEGIKWIRVNKVPCRDDSGTITGIAGYAIDITHQMNKAAEQRRQHIEIELNPHEHIEGVHLNEESIKPDLDINRIQQAEQTRREGDNEYKILYETALVGLFRTRISDGKVIWANRACANLLGYLDSASIIDDGFIFSKYYTDGRRSELIKQLTDRGQVYDFEAHYALPAGREIDVAISARIFPDKGYLEGVMIDITERKRAEDLLKKSIQEKEVLLREVHHRVKNNMQIISSLLRLHASKIEDKQYHDFLIDFQNRIRSLALIHEMLYASGDLTKVDFLNYVNTLSYQMLQSSPAYKKGVKLNLNIQVTTLGIDLAIPSALIIDELLLNALKHAFPENMNGEITVEFTHHGAACYQLVISDNGIGISGNFDINNTESFGLYLVRILVNQIKGTINFDPHNGASFIITFPGSI